MGARGFYVYILASRIGGTLYIGVTTTSFAASTSIKRALPKVSPKIMT
jgi:predicted GIY-YIG superfamily endonuclease